jgi:hypothetical protein
VNIKTPPTIIKRITPITGYSFLFIISLFLTN